MADNGMSALFSGLALVVVVALAAGSINCAQSGGCNGESSPRDEPDVGPADVAVDGDDGTSDASDVDGFFPDGDGSALDADGSLPDGDEVDVPPPIDDPPECPTDGDEPLGVILTWQSDPTSTMTIDWHTDRDDPRESICFRRAGDDQWRHRVDATHREIPHLERDLYRVELTELRSDAEYVFQAGDYEREFRFRTMPESDDERAVLFASGGDLRDENGAEEGWFVKTNEMVMDYDPDFVVWGGDLAYADGGAIDDHRDRWREFLAEKFDTLIDGDGRVVPVLAGIGNHEVRKGYKHRYDTYQPTAEWRQQEAPYFYSMFAFPGQPGYNAMDFGDYLSIIVLDTRHSNPIPGPQTDWLEQVLEKRADRGVDHILPFFHYPAYPSKSPLHQQLPRQIREQWIPLFEEYGVEVAFQHKDHAFMRSHPIRDGEIDEEDGIVYLGNGNWGATLRRWLTEVDWHADKFVSTHHAYITTVYDGDIYIRAVDSDGELLDEYGEQIP